MTTPKSPEQIMEEFESYTSGQPKDGVYLVSIFSQKAWLRSSMASLLCYMAERMTKKEKDICSGCQFGYQGGCACAYSVHNDTIDDCRTLLIEEARKITNSV